jgi:pyridinium-3,5-biscarboxylic acid mononucleotide sulfurtransferase
MTDESLENLAQKLIETIRSYESVAVAFSGGVDSAVVAKASALALGNNAVAVTALSPSLATGELDEAKEVAEQIGIRHEIIKTDEFQNDQYLANPSNRCFFCKTELYTQLVSRIDELGVKVILNGANLDDTGDHRPGMQAAREHAVRSPLIEVGLRKSHVRELAKLWNLPVWDKPAMPCLSSRIAYGVEVTPDRVRRIDSAERFLKEQLELSELRVRLEANELARIEVPLESMPRLLEADNRSKIATHFRELGFQYVTIDLEGFRSGSMNAILPIESLTVLN